MTGLQDTRTTILNAGSPEAKRQEIRDYSHQTFTLDETFYDTLAGDDAFYLRAEPLRHPLIFYLGHTGVFYINKLTVANITHQRINPESARFIRIAVQMQAKGIIHYELVEEGDIVSYHKRHLADYGLSEVVDHFQMIGTPRDIEFVIRETRRKFQHTVSQMTVWERVA